MTGLPPRLMAMARDERKLTGERVRREEHRWPVVVALLVAMGLFLTLPSTFLPAFRYTVVGIGLVVLVPLIVVNPVRFQHQTRWSRRLSIAETLLLLAANQVALVLLVDHLVYGDGISGRRLLVSAAQVWVTNVIAFAMLYWEIDRGGPVARSMGHVQSRRTDLRFPNDDAGRADVPHLASAPAPHVASTPAPWRPDFLDYLFTSLWTSTAFSPTDAMPLTRRMKALMALESVSGLLIFALVIGRSVNLFQ